MSDKITDEIFQIAPKKPNFKLIVVLSVATLMVLILAAYVLLSVDAGKLIHGTHQESHPTSYKIPAPSAAVNA
jgi:hypothetical protein